jgi:hypothetical protein
LQDIFLANERLAHIFFNEPPILKKQNFVSLHDFFYHSAMSDQPSSKPHERYKEHRYSPATHLRNSQIFSLPKDVPPISSAKKPLQSADHWASDKPTTAPAATKVLRTLSVHFPVDVLGTSFLPW